MALGYDGRRVCGRLSGYTSVYPHDKLGKGTEKNVRLRIRIDRYSRNLFVAACCSQVVSASEVPREFMRFYAYQESQQHTEIVLPSATGNEQS